MIPPKELVIIGAGGLAAEIIEAAELAGWRVTKLYDDNPAMLSREVLGRKCYGIIDAFERSSTTSYHIAIGRNDVRQKLGVRLSNVGHQEITVIHPNAIVSRAARIGQGTYIGAGAFVSPDVQVGSYSIINVGATIGHNATLGNWVQICPGARISGFGVLGDGVFIGSNAVVGPGVALGEWSKLGASSFAARNVPAHNLAVGIPARIITQ